LNFKPGSNKAVLEADSDGVGALAPLSTTSNQLALDGETPAPALQPPGPVQHILDNVDTTSTGSSHVCWESGLLAPGVRTLGKGPAQLSLNIRALDSELLRYPYKVRQTISRAAYAAAMRGCSFIGKRHLSLVDYDASLCALLAYPSHIWHLVVRHGDISRDINVAV
jgi:hypothetical protein